MNLNKIAWLATTMSYDFETTTYGKWILAGEHAVIRGYGALVFPIKEKNLTLCYRETNTERTVHYQGESGSANQLLFWKVIEQGMLLLDRSIETITGHFTIDSNIPVGVGMGASAALCVAIARWFVAYQSLPAEELNQFAKELEHLFHGKSSGLDIAGVATSSGVYFKQGNCTPVIPTWHPQWYLSSCGEIGMTSNCIQLVNRLWQEKEAYAELIDLKMASSVQQARDALEKNTSNATEELAQAINNAADCFYQWGLVSNSLQQHMTELKDAGAIAVKPTGSGCGGYVLSLWNKKAPSFLKVLVLN